MESGADCMHASAGGVLVALLHEHLSLTTAVLTTMRRHVLNCSTLKLFSSSSVKLQGPGLVPLALAWRPSGSAEDMA